MSDSPVDTGRRRISPDHTTMAAERRLPGKPRARQEVLREYQDRRWALMPYEVYRWRIQLECGHITEVLTHGDKTPPSSGDPWRDPVHWRELPKGQVVCPELTEHDEPAPYREIAIWLDRREVTFPADPIEPPDDIVEAAKSGDEAAQLWAHMRHHEPYTTAFWTVTLSCGHATEVPTDMTWDPADGPRRVSAARQQEMTAEWEEWWASDPGVQEEREREHTRRMLADGWPIPQTEQLCYTCPRARRIVAYQRVGWLAPKPKLETKTIDLSHYEHVGDPDQPNSLTKKDERKQADSERMRDAVRKSLEANPPPPLSDAAAQRIRDLLSASVGTRRASDLVRWRLRLYCGHVVEKTAHYTHQTVHSAFTGSVSCPECGLEPATIVAARPLGRLEDPNEPKPRTPSRDSIERRLRKVEAEATRLREKLAEIGDQPDDH